MNLIIDDELKKIKKLLQDTITLGVDIVPNFDWGNKISIRCYQMIDNKMTEYEYEFYIKYDENKDNYANAPYLLHCGYNYNLGGGGYADKYESIDDFKKTRLYLDLLKDYGRNKKIEEVDEINDSPTLFDEEETIDEINTEELTLFDLDTEENDDEILNVSNEDNQLSLFDESEPIDNNVDLKDLMSYGIDDYYKKNFEKKCVLLNKIRDELGKLPKYNEYYSKLKTYLKNKLPNKTFQESDFHDKPTYITNASVITINGNSRQCPIYCYQMYKNMFE